MRDVLELLRSPAIGRLEPEVVLLLKALGDEIQALRFKVEELHRRVINLEAGQPDPPSLHDADP